MTDIYSIKNAWLRRAAVVTYSAVAIPFLITLDILIFIVEYIDDRYGPQIRSAWRGRP